MKQKTLFHSCIVLLLFLLVQLSFTRCSSDDTPVNLIPVLSINETAAGINFSQATLEGVVTDNGSNVSRCGFLVNTAKGVLEKAGIDEASVYEGSRTANGNVKVTINNLKANTTYYYCLFVVSGNTPIKSAISHFTTDEIGEPSFSKIEFVEIGEDSIVVRCRMLNNGGQPIEKLGIDYKLADGQIFSNIPVEGYDEDSTDSTFTCTISPLEPGTKYHFRATGFNGVKYGYSEIAEATTNAKTSPTVSIGTIDEAHIGVNYVLVTGKIEDTGAADITERGFLIGTVSKPVMGMEGVTNVPVYEATNDFSATIENLKPFTTYYVRAYAANNPYGNKTQYGYSDPVELTTKNWETPSFGDMTELLEGIKLRVSCTLDNKGINILERGFCYSITEETPDLTHHVIKSESEDNKMTASFQIQENTPYHIRPYVKYNLTGEEEVTYGAKHTSQSYTFDRPSISETTHSEVTYSTAKLSATVVNNGVTVTKRGFKWGKSSTPTNDIEATGSEFQATLEELTPGVTYYYRAYVEFELAGKKETVTSKVSSFKTVDVVKPELGEVTSKQQQNYLSLTSLLTKENDVEVTEVGFCWSKAIAEPDLTNSDVTQGTLEDGDIKATITVDEYATYYIRSYAKYSLAGVTGTVYSSVHSVEIAAFTRPSFSEVKSSDITYTTATLHATLMDKGLTITKRGFKWGTSEKVANDQPIAEGAFQAALEGLEPGTTYYYQAYAVYELAGMTGTATSEVSSFVTTDVAKPELGEVSFKQLQNNLSLTSTLTKEEDVEITEMGFCWSKENGEPDLTNSSVTQGTLKQNSITATITVEESITYYIRSYAKYSLAGVTGTVYSSVQTLTTDAFVRPNFSEISSTDITYSTAKLNATVVNNGLTITKRGFKWGKSSTPTTDIEVADGEFQTTLEGLTPGVTYYYQAYVEFNLAGKTATVSSKVSSFKTLDVAKPELGEVSSKQQQNNLSLTSTLTKEEDVEITEMGFCWSKENGEPDLTNSSVTQGTLKQNDITATITVEENVTYYIRSYAKYSLAGVTGTVYSTVQTLTTDAFTRPSFSEVSSTDITYSTATLSATVVNNGLTITKRGFKWGKSSTPTTDIEVADGEFQTTLEGLTPGVTYYYQAYVEFNLAGKTATVSSKVSSFKTLDVVKPELGEVSSNQQQNKLSLTSLLTKVADVEVTEVGFCWSKGNSEPDLTNSDVTQGTLEDGDIKATITVDEYATYYIRSYAKYNLAGVTGTVYSSTQTVEIAAFTRPSFSEVKSTDITYTTAMLNATLMDKGLTVTKRGFKWGKSEKVANDLPITEGAFQATLEGLEPGTTYYYQAYAVYELAGKTETVTSDILSFKTVDVNKPALGDVTYKQQQTKLALTSSLTKEDDVTITEFGFCYSQTTTEPDLNSSVASGTMDEENMTATIAVEENTQYYIRSYVKYSVAGTTGTVYSNVLTMTTESYVRPSLSEVKSSDVTYNAASLRAMLTNNGVTVTERGFKWGTSSNPTTKVKASGSDFKVGLTDLNPATKYYYRAYVVYKIDEKEETTESEVYSFETLSSPEPILGAVNTSQNANTLSLSCQLTDNGVEVSEVGFCWSKSETVPTVKNNPTVGTLDNGYFTASISIAESTTYYVRAYAKYEALGISLVSYSEVKAFTSDSFTRPSISNVTHSEVKISSAKLSATITSNGVDVTSKGFKWGTSASSMTTQKVTTDDFVYTLTNLNANTTYYYEAYVTFKIGDTEETKSSSQGSFTTQSIAAATVTLPEISSIGFHEATATSTITSTGDGTVKKKGFVWSSATEYPTLDDKQGSVELAADAEFKAQVTGLTDATRYYIRAYVVSEGSGQTVTSYSEGGRWSGRYFDTTKMTLPSLSTPSATEITQTTIKVTASLKDGGNTDVTELGFCWSDQDIDPKDMTNKTTVTADNFTVTITDTEKAGNTYYIYAYATNGKGTAYSQKFTATLKYIPGAGDNPRPGKE